MLEVVEVGLANRSCSMSAQRPRITGTSIPPYDTFRKSKRKAVTHHIKVNNYFSVEGGGILFCDISE